MPSINQTINTSLGPVVDIIIGVSTPRKVALEKSDQDVPDQIKARLLIDTGASHTCLDCSIVKSLGLSSSGVTDVYTPTTGAVPEQRDLFDVKIIIPHSLLSRIVHAAPIIASDMSSLGIDGLLGRDLLDSCVFIYNGSNGQYTLSM